ncbi:NADP-dependent oxidoreductase domain-containing protein [Aspergillus alliaceus]|uniref:NADP-dependent oxidoreductase domain-containing protein n=1 Tax=Petromyces alliaceus TaxID=209559 RepID=UPI0012A65556|nr:NADP-dependent oxidoreductase domain-containing protein [Aspergillus alliaceus]KAB8228981.1 NADP-dependent oxidoreductase domain-containing protein [Aspergillus alliaceus]
MLSFISFGSWLDLNRCRQLAPSASVRDPPLCLGARTFGTAGKKQYGVCSKDDAIEILDYFLASRNNRDTMVIAAKYTAGYRGLHKDIIHANCGGNGTKSMRVSLEASLRKLQTTYIDLFYIHSWDYTVSIPELMHSLKDHVTSGKGIWNASLRDFERDIIPMCRDEGIGLCPDGVLNQDRFQTEAGFKAHEKSHDGRNSIPLSDRDKRFLASWKLSWRLKGVELLQVALAYVLHRTPYVFPIIGARKLNHIKWVIPAAAYTFDLGFPHTFLSGTLFTSDAS